jgi:hypothetical protein
MFIKRVVDVVYVFVWSVLNDMLLWRGVSIIALVERSEGLKRCFWVASRRDAMMEDEMETQLTIGESFIVNVEQVKEV